MKKALLTLGLFLMVSAVALSQSQVLSGSWGGIQEKIWGGYRWVFTVEVNFLKPFENKPDVVVGVSAIDAVSGTNLRYSLKAKSVSRDGFTVEVKTWGDSKILSIGGFWVAHAETTSMGSDN